MPGLENPVGDKGRALSTLCVRIGTEKAQKNNRLFENICLGLVLKESGFRITFYRNMSNSTSVISNHVTVDKCKHDLKRSENMSLGNKAFSIQTLTLPWHNFVFGWFRSVV